MTFIPNTSKRHMPIWRSFLCLVAITALFVGCTQKAEGDAKADKVEPAAATATAAAAAAPAAGASSEADCEAYSKALCKAAGEQTPTCGAVKQVVKLMNPNACKAGMADMEYTKKRLSDANKVCDELIAKLCGDLGNDTETCKMVKEKTPDFGGEQCAKMMGEYDKVLESLVQMEAANKPLGADKIAKINAEGAGEFGSKDAKVTIVEFSDFQCPYCTQAAMATTKIKKEYGDKVRVIFRHFPLDFHKEAHLAAQASMAANAQGKFWEFHDLLFANQKALGRADLEKYAGQLKLDMGKFKKALDSGTYKDAVDADMALGKLVVVQGTPTMFINGKRAQNPGDFLPLKEEIDKLLAQ